MIVGQSPEHAYLGGGGMIKTSERNRCARGRFCGRKNCGFAGIDSILPTDEDEWLCTPGRRVPRSPAPAGLSRRTCPPRRKRAPGSAGDAACCGRRRGLKSHTKVVTTPQRRAFPSFPDAHHCQQLLQQKNSGLTSGRCLKSQCGALAPQHSDPRDMG